MNTTEVYFSCHEKYAPEISLRYELDGDEFTIKEFVNFCRSFAHAIGFADENIKQYFPED